MLRRFLVEVYAPRSAVLSELEAAARLAAEAPLRRRARVRYLDSVFVPEDETCFHLFEASSAEDVCRAARGAGLRCQRVVEAVR
jgi:hypothetical protein